MNAQVITYEYSRLTYPALVLVIGLLIVRYWAQIGVVRRWVRFQYNALPAQLQGAVQSLPVIVMGYVWLRILHWPLWLLIGLGIAAVTYAVVRHMQERRDLQKRIRQMLNDHRSTIQGVAFLGGVFLLAWGWSWLRWILTHEVE